MPRNTVGAITLAIVLCPAMAWAQALQQGPQQPVVAVMNFTNSSLVDNATYEPFTVGLAGMLLSELRANPRVALIERERLNQVLEEVARGQSGQIDPNTAARVGKVLGAGHMIFGAFVIDRRGNLRIDARAVNVETSLVEHVETVTDDADNLLRAVQRLGRQLSERMHLPASPARGETGRTLEEAKRGQVLANLKYARALLEEDRNNAERAVQLYREFLAESPPGYAPRQREEAEARIRVLTASGSAEDG